MNNYCYLVSVYDGSRIRVISVEPNQNLKAGDLVRLSDDKLAEVTHVIFVKSGGDEYQFIAAAKAIEDDWIEFYYHGGKRKEAFDGSSA